MAHIAGLLLALCLILAGIQMMDTKQDAALTSAVVTFAEKTDDRLDSIEGDLELIKYGQLLTAGFQANSDRQLPPIIITGK